MPGLKEVRTRIASVKSTQQITSAMKMVSASKLKKTQNVILKMRPYAGKLKEILENLPFQKNENLHIYSFICENGDEDILFEEFKKVNHQEDEEAEIINQNFYWKIPIVQ